MKATWLKTCKTDEDRKKREAELLRSKIGFDFLADILKSRLKHSVPTPDYESPSWAYKEADRHGYNRALTEVLELIEGV